MLVQWFSCMSSLTPLNPPLTLSIIIPVFNEQDYFEALFKRVLETELPDGITREIIIVDDASTDETKTILKQLEDQSDTYDASINIYYHDKNKGKGAAIQTALPYMTGDIALIQDADLEYDPDEYGILLDPILSGKADVVYGSRFAGAPHRTIYFWNSVGNKFLTFLSNVLTNLNLTDMECCYKVFRKEMLEGLTIKENRFGFEPEITAKMSKRKARIFEVPVSYAGRSYEEGKKIGFKDGLSALRCILKYNLFG